ncbi:hypothetical protein ACIQNU_21230 [Streptomyces sp. NPDC091292]|uniref:hypothetical protein n=1 Tax=Streptomyces sp. NPDC091292 TaxID=3365991 RepID=UPI00381CC872
MVRNVIGSVLALIGAAAAVWSPFLAWYDGRLGRTYRVPELFTANGVTGARAELFTSLFLPFAAAALITLIGIALRSRLVVALAGVIVLGFTVLWMVRVGQAAGSLVVAGDGTGLGLGVAAAFGGGALLLIASGVMSGRARRERWARTDDYQGPGDATLPTLDGPPTTGWDRPPDHRYGGPPDGGYGGPPDHRYGGPPDHR